MLRSDMIPRISKNQCQPPPGGPAGGSIQIFRRPLTALPISLLSGKVARMVRRRCARHGAEPNIVTGGMPDAPHKAILCCRAPVANSPKPRDPDAVKGFAAYNPSLHRSPIDGSTRDTFRPLAYDFRGSAVGTGRTGASHGNG